MMLMGKNVKLADLSKTVLIEQLQLCWKHFRACQLALDGVKDVQPVELLECEEFIGCEDLELFYKCKKKAEEIAWLEKGQEEVKDGN